VDTTPDYVEHAAITRRFTDGTEITVPCTCDKCGISIVDDAQNPVTARSEQKESLSPPEISPDILSRSKEIEYSLILNAGRHLATLEGQVPPGQEVPPPTDSTILILNHLAAQMPLLDILCSHWDMPPIERAGLDLDTDDDSPRMSFQNLIGEQVRQKLVTSEISNELKSEIAVSIGCRPRDVFEKIDRLALTCWLLPPGVQELDKHVRDLSTLNEFLDDDGDARHILGIESEKSDFKSHFASLRSTYEETRDIFFHANTGLVGKHVREQLAIYDGRLDSFQSEARREGLVGLAEARERFSHRMATNSTADRPFAAYAHDWILYRVRRFLAMAADDVIDPSSRPEEASPEWSEGIVNLSQIGGVLSEPEIEILLLAAEQRSINFAEIGRTLNPRMNGRKVSRLRYNALNKINFHADAINRQHEFVVTLPEHITDNFCTVQRIVLNARIVNGLGFAEIGDTLSETLSARFFLTDTSSNGPERCALCSENHHELSKLSEKQGHTRRQQPERIMGNIEKILKENNIELPVVAQARGTNRRKY